jgi:predicted MarR family transcription regulator
MKQSDDTKIAQVCTNEHAHNNQCRPLTTSERLVLAALRANQWGKTVTDLQYATGLSDKFIRLSLRKLEQNHLVCS